MDQRGDPTAHLRAAYMSKPTKPRIAAREGELVPVAGSPLAEVRIGRLATARAVSTELSRVYRASRRGDIDPTVATKHAYVLNVLLGSLKVSDLESRLDRLEDAAALKRLPGAASSSPQDYDSAEAAAIDAAIIGTPAE